MNCIAALKDLDMNLPCLEIILPLTAYNHALGSKSFDVCVCVYRGGGAQCKPFPSC